MSSFNKVILMGNLTRDPQLKQLPTSTPVCEFGLAVNRRYKSSTGEDREDVLFVDCSAFGKQAEILHQYCQKGKPLFIEGRLKYDTWEDKQTASPRSKLSVVIENFQFIGSRDPQSPTPGSNTPDPRPAKLFPDAPPAKTSSRKRADPPKFKEADIPF